MLDDRIARDDGALAERGLGLWHCDLGDDSLNWTDGVYDIFGLERGTAVPRPLAVSLYAPDSSAAMERLRAYAFRHRRGFPVDVDIRTAAGGHVPSGKAGGRLGKGLFSQVELRGVRLHSK